MKVTWIAALQFVAVQLQHHHATAQLILPASSRFQTARQQQVSLTENANSNNPPTVTPPLRREQGDALCEAKTRHFTGSIPLDHGKEIFYWLFESMDSPKDDPVVVWLSGGPGGASTFAALTEVGPCFIDTPTNMTYYNPYSWAKHANLLIVDQPAGVGFSKQSPDPAFHVTSLENATYDFNLFLYKFFDEAFPELSGNDLHLASESYGGRWGPAFLHHTIGFQNARAETSIKNPVKSLILVNAVIGALGGHLTAANYEFGCTPKGQATKLGLGFDSATCDRLKELGPQCEGYAALCERERNLQVCKDASQFCEGNLGAIIDLKGRSPFNIKRTCADENNLCIDEKVPVEAFFNSTIVKKELGMDGYAYSMVSNDVLTDFANSGALTQSVLPDMVDLLDSTNVRVLFMNGDLDSLVITAGQKRIVDEVPWKGQLDYRQQEWRDWYFVDSNGQEVHGGQRKNSTKLAFVTFNDAGHMVPMDQPEASLEVLRQWLKG